MLNVEVSNRTALSHGKFCFLGIVCCRYLNFLFGVTYCFLTTCWLTHNQLSRNVSLFSCNPIGQLCLGDPAWIQQSRSNFRLPERNRTAMVTRTVVVSITLYIRFHISTAFRQIDPKTFFPLGFVDSFIIRNWILIGHLNYTKSVELHYTTLSLLLSSVATELHEKLGHNSSSKTVPVSRENVS